jgi:hypothetical protein
VGAAAAEWEQARRADSGGLAVSLAVAPADGHPGHRMPEGPRRNCDEERRSLADRAAQRSGTRSTPVAAQPTHNREIGNLLWISTNTVKFHVSNTYRKLEVNWRTQAVGKARSLGLIA